jgi:hypothetical protein
LHQYQQEQTLRDNLMACLDKDNNFLMWLAESDEAAAAHLSASMETEPEPGAKDSGPEGPEPHYGFIVQDWFGPFLFSPCSYAMRGKC